MHGDSDTGKFVYGNSQSITLLYDFQFHLFKQKNLDVYSISLDTAEKRLHSVGRFARLL